MPRNNMPVIKPTLRLLFIITLAASAAAQGRIIPHHHPPIPGPMPRPVPPPVRQTPLQLKYLTINAEITDGVAVTALKQTFHNRSRRQIEGTYVFPLPDDAAVGSFNMTIDGKKMHGEVLDKETARRTYEEIVRRTRDPGLLEYLGSRLYQASIFPIPSGGVAEIELEYSQTLPESAGLGAYRHPLRNASAGAGPIEQFVLHVKLNSQQPLTSVFCPTHKCEILRPSDRTATVSLERANARLDTDLQLYYLRTDAMFGLSLLTHRSAGEDGYFLLRVSPRLDITADQIQPKDIAFVIDTSGSMQGGKIEQVKKSLEFCVNSLNPDDRFNIFTFSTEVHPFRDGLVPADDDIKAAAVEFSGKLNALGGTNINGALLAALEADPGDDERPYLIVFMTDGKPTISVSEPETILGNVKKNNARRVRFHVLGVGTDVNTHLLDKLAEINRGTRDYCDDTEDLELKLSAFVTRLANPVLTDITLNILNLKTSDIYPQTLPDLFRGGNLVVLGRYNGDGAHNVNVEGRLLGETKSLAYDGSFPARDSAHDFLPRLWAQRKIAYLLDQIRLHGRNEELVVEVVRLAKRHGIVTPYTSALVLEDDMHVRMRTHMLSVPGIEVDAAAKTGFGTPRMDPGQGMSQRSGRRAVAESRDLYAAQKEVLIPNAGAAFDIAWDEATEGKQRQVLKHIAEKTFVFDGRRWLDTTWDGKQQSSKIVAFSNEYFDLLSKHPELAKFFALGDRVLVVYNGEIYETTPEAAPSEVPTTQDSDDK